MNSNITFEYEGKKYTLEYTRASIKKMEAQGFDINKLESAPMTMIDLVIKGSFLANHSYLTEGELDDILAHLTNKNGLLEVLSGMIGETYESLLEDPSDDEKNIIWKATELTPKKSA